MSVARRRSPVGVGLQFAGLAALLIGLLAPLLGIIGAVDMEMLATGDVDVSAWAVAGVAIALPGFGSVVLGAALNHS